LGTLFVFFSRLMCATMKSFTAAGSPAMFRMLRLGVAAIALRCTFALDAGNIENHHFLQDPKGDVLSSVALPPEAHDYPRPDVPAVQETTPDPQPKSIPATGHELPVGETPIDVEIPVVGRKEHRLPFTVETILALTYISLIASTPFLLVAFDKQEFTRSQIGQSIALFVWLGGALYFFTNVILFNSYHFPGERSLTLVETIYFISQVVTTVGYGDITPSRGRGQVFVGVFVLMSILLIAQIVSRVADALINSAKDFSKKVASQVAFTGRRLSSVSLDVSSDPLHAPAQGGRPFSARPISPRAQVVMHDWVKIGKPPHPSYGAIVGASCTFLFFVVIGVLFYHLCPGEDKTWFQAIYMSIITLSTVGFGAFTATTEMGKVFGAFWMLFGVGALGGVVAAFSHLMLTFKELQQWDFAKKREDFQTLSHEMKFFTPRGENSKKIDKYQFMKFGLLHAGVVSNDEFNRMENSFNRILQQQAPGASAEKVTLGGMEQLWC